MSSWNREVPGGYRPDVVRVALGAVLASALLLPGLARADLLPGSQGAQDALLAVAPDGSPRVAFVAADGSLQVAARAADGTWSAQTLAGLPGQPGARRRPRASLPAARRACSRRTRPAAGSPSPSSRAPPGASASSRAPPRAACSASAGSRSTPPAGRSSPTRTRSPSQQSWLRLVHEDARGRLVGERVTRDGFPASEALPAAAPVVLPGGAVRVLETYDSATIEWARTKSHKDWIGQFVYGTTLGSPAGVVQAQAVIGAVWSAWTELFPSFGESQLLLTVHGHGESTVILSHHAFLVSLALTAGGPEVAGDDYVDLAGARTAYAGIVVDTAGAAVELAGDLYGYAVDASGGRQYLLLDQNGLGWYRAATAPAAKVELAATVDGASFGLSGRVDGVSSGSVEVWRETTAGPELAHLPPTRGRRLLRAQRPAARAAAHVSRRLSRPGQRAAARGALPHAARRLKVAHRLFHRLHRSAVEMLIIQNPQNATFSCQRPLAPPLPTP